MNSKNLKAIVSWVGVGLLWGALMPAAAQPSSCYQVSLKPRPAWVSSATFIEDRSQLLVIDPFQNRILAYSPESGEAASVADVELKSGAPFYPTAVAHVAGGKFLLELSDGETVLLDHEFRLLKEPPAAEKKTAGLRIGSLYQWKVLGNTLIAYGSLITGSGDALKVDFGFFRVPIKDATLAKPEILKRSGDSSYFLLGYSYIVTTSGAAYFVSMDEDHPAIYRVLANGHEIEKLAAFPQDPEFRSRPRFQTRMTGPKSAPAHFAELATFSVISGLYEQNGMLYLLARKPDSDGKTAWYLYKIDPAGKGKVLGSMKLPTSSEHLTVVPGSKKWFLLERGPVQELQRQDIAKMVVIESSAISNLSLLPSSCPAK